MPLPPPVMTATLPCNLDIVFYSSRSNGQEMAGSD
jgi:hypothetical protein